MSVITYDTHAIVKELEDAGYTKNRQKYSVSNIESIKPDLIIQACRACNEKGY